MNVLYKRKIILLCFLVLLAILVVVYLTFWGFPGQKEEIETSLKKIDNFILKANLQEAESLLSRLFLQAKTSEAYLQLLKRFHSIALIKNDFKTLQTYALQAHEKLSGNVEIGLIAVYASLRTGDLDTSLKISAEFAEEKTAFPFFSEAMLRGNMKIDMEKLNSVVPLKELLELESTADPDIFLAIAERYDVKKLFLDAALLAAKNGNYKNAFIISEKYLHDSQYNEVAGIMAYDAGEYSVAFSRLKDVLRDNSHRPEIYTIVGDIAIKLDLLEEAVRFYLKAIGEDARYSVIPYINLAFIYKKQDKIKEAQKILEDAQSYFPQDKLLTIEMVKLQYSLGEKDKAAILLNKYLEQNKDDLDANLLSIFLEWGDISPEQYKIKLRELFSRDLKNQKSCQVLAWYLINADELDSAWNVLAEYELAVKASNTAWLFHIKGIIEALKGNKERAASLLQESLFLQDNWQVRYNYAVVLYAAGQIKSSLDELHKIINYFETQNTEKNTSELSKIRAKIGIIHLQKGNLDAARLELQLALELDAKNVAAWRALKKLEDLAQK